MSLFPAYNVNESENQNEDLTNEKWLENKSYQVSKPDRSRSSSPTERRRRSRTPKRHKRRSGSPNKHRRRSRSRSRSYDRKKRRRSRTPKKKRKRDTKSPEATREELIVKYSANKTFLEDIDVAPEHAFRRDKTRDRSLLTFPTLPISVTSSYSKHWKRDNDELCNFYHAFVPNGNQRRSKRSKRYFGKEFQLLFNRGDLLQKLNDLSSFLNKDKQIEFRSFYRMVRESNDDYVQDNLNDDENDIKLHKIQLETKEFNQKLRQAPQDVDLWIKYVDFQDTALADSEFVIGQENKKKKKSSKNASVMVRSKAIVEKKLSILKSALDQNPKSVILSVKRLTLSKEILDSSTLNRQWKELIFLFPTDVQVWDHYLTFLTSHFTTFTLTQITGAFKECFTRLQAMVGHAFRNDHEDLEDQMSHLLVRLWHLWARAGYREKSVALFQALLEINLNAPAFPGYFSSQDKLATFEPFWEASVPRFGEKGALGWSKFAKEHVMEELEAEGGGNNPTEEEDNLVAEFGGKVDNVQLWLKLELLREAKHYLPYRVTHDDEEEVEDSDRIILYDQLEGLLYQFQDPCQVFKLYLSFFYFLGLDLYYEDSIECGLLGTQAFHNWVGSNHPQIHDIDDKNGGTLLLGGVVKPEATFIQCLFEQGIAAFTEPFRTQIILLWLKYECDNLNDYSLEQPLSKAKKSKAKELKGRTMQFLQEDQHNSRVYVSYALALNKLEGYKSAKKVLDMALLSTSTSQKGQNDIVFTHAANLELKAGNSDNALWIWALMAHKRPFSPCTLNKTQLLAFASQAREVFGQELKSLLKKENCNNQEVAMLKSVPCMPNSQLLALVSGLWGITYIMEGPVALHQSFRDVLQNIKVESLLRDACYQIKHHLLENHETSAAARKETILEWLTEFPHSHNALRRLRNINVQTAISSAFWRSLQSALTSKVTSPVGHLAMIKLLTEQFKLQSNLYEEEEYNQDQMGHLFKAWTWLNQMVQKEPCRTCPQAWRLLMWTSHMLSKKNPFRYQAKTIFYRALQDNPSAKVLGLDLLHYQGGAKLQAEIQDIFAEKEVRIRLPMEELQVLLEAEEDLD